MRQALELFWERGYEGTSIAELVSAMGVTPPALYAAFGSKENLFREVLELYFSGVGFDPSIYFVLPTAREVVERFLREAAAAYSSPAHARGCMVATGMLGYAPEHQGVAMHITELRRVAREALEARFRAARKAGDLPKDADPAALAGFYFSVLQGMSVQARDGASKNQLLRIGEVALRALP
ncbi:TetR/AcrR family transcriptional regulator [Rugamonas sp.]|uniref:TetR/AcrR family transcriptional regulator n=1 Tax=Rugamonas sp. TaxID=1926287 RepID=UPI0025E8E87A|nr:TetR/AcrR family transcriptional regulator [Rugamonas sp.]